MMTCLYDAGKLLSARHAAERLQLCWHSGDFSIEDLRHKIQVQLLPISSTFLQSKLRRIKMR